MKKNLIWNNISFAGIFCFFLLFYIAAQLYPGGTHLNPYSEGFDWINNYWCHLLNESAKNGKINIARPVALSATGLICISLIIFQIQFALKLCTSQLRKNVIIFIGAFTMICTSLLCTPLHDIITIISSFSGLVVLILVLFELHLNEYTKLFYWGVFATLLLIFINIIYNTEFLILHLPWLQKVSLVFILFWIIFVNLEIRKKLLSNK